MVALVAGGSAAFAGFGRLKASATSIVRDERRTLGSGIPNALCGVTRDPTARMPVKASMKGENTSRCEADNAKVSGRKCCFRERENKSLERFDSLTSHSLHFILPSMQQLPKPAHFKIARNERKKLKCRLDFTACDFSLTRLWKKRRHLVWSSALRRFFSRSRVNEEL